MESKRQKEAVGESGLFLTGKEMIVHNLSTAISAKGHDAWSEMTEMGKWHQSQECRTVKCVFGEEGSSTREVAKVSSEKAAKK